MLRKLFPGIVALMVFSGAYAAPIEVVKTVGENPKINYKGVSGHAEFDKAVGSLLRATGWFEVVTSNALYSLGGSVSGNSAKLKLEMGGVGILDLTVSIGPEVRKAAKQAVDMVLERTFRELEIKGFASTKIAFSCETGKGIKDIYYCDIDGGGVTRLTRFQSLCVEPTWFPDGKSIAYTRYNQGSTDIVETRLNPVQSRRLTGLKGLNTGVTFSPEQKLLAIISSSSADHFVDLYVRSLEGSSKQMKRLTKNKAVEASPCFSPDGKSICFVSDVSGSPRLYLIPSSGGSAKRLPSAGGEAVTPDWSDDGEKIIYSTRSGGNYALAIYNVKTNENRILTKDSAAWESPSWAPDNRHAVCTRSSGGKVELYVVDTYSGKTRRLLGGSKVSMPAWSKAAVE